MSAVFNDADIVAKSFFGSNKGDSSFIHNRFNDYLERMPASVMSYASSMVDTARDMYNSFHHNSQLNRMVDACIHKVNNLWDTDTIKALHDYLDIQQAKHQMQRWVMANPDINELYNAGRISGYEATYTRPEDYDNSFNYDYRRATHGVVGTRTVDDCNVTEVKRYYEHTSAEDLRLTAYDRIAIHQTWKALETALEEGADPTSTVNGMIE